MFTHTNSFNTAVNNLLLPVLQSECNHYEKMMGNDIYPAIIADLNQEVFIRDKQQILQAIGILREIPLIPEYEYFIYKFTGVAFGLLAEYSKSIKYLQLAYEIRQNDVALLYYLGVSLFNSEQPKEAIFYLESAININPSYLKPFYTLGICLNKYGKKEKAKKHFSFCINNKYHEVYSLVNRAIIYSTENNNSKAVKDLEKALAINPLYEKTYFNLASIYDRLGEPNKAINLYQKAIELNPKYALARYNLGHIYMENNDYVNALIELKMSNSIKESADTLNTCGICYSNLNDHANASKSFEAAVTLNPKDEKFLFNLGLSYFHLHRFALVIQQMDKILELEVSCVKAIKIRSYAKNALNDKEGAIKDLELFKFLDSYEWS